MRWLLSGLAAAVLPAAMTIAWAQGAPGAGMGNPTATPGQTRDYVPQSSLANLANLVDSKHLQEGRNAIPPQVVESRSRAILDALHVTCHLKAAESRGSGEEMLDGKPEKVGIFEVACDDGMGYLLTMLGPSTQSGVPVSRFRRLRGPVGWT